MKKALFFGILAVAAISLSSCEEAKDKDTAQIATEALEALKADTTKTASADAKEAPDAKAAKDNKENKEEKPSSGIVDIDMDWTNSSFHTVAKVPGIKQLMAQFCAKYPHFQGNELILRYLANEAGYNAEKDSFGIEDKEAIGYLKSTSPDQFPATTAGRIWDRDSGHKLFGVALQKVWESGDRERLVAFYDIDPKTGEVTPDNNVTAAMEEYMKCVKGDFEVVFPNEGKHVEFKIIDEEGKEGYYLVRWDGITFKFDPKVRTE